MINEEAERRLGMILSYINTILQALLGFIYVPILLNYMGTSQYGLYQLMGSMIAYFNVMDFGLSTAVIRYYLSFKKYSLGELQKFLDTIQKLYIGIACLALIIGVCIYYFLNKIFSSGLTENELYDAKKIYIVLLINIIIILLGMLYRAIITSHEKFLFLKGIETIQFIVQPILVIAILQFWPTAYAMSLGMTFLNAVLTLSRFYYAKYKLGIRINFFNRTFEKRMIAKIHGLVLSTFVVSIADQIFLKSNQIILGIVSGTYSVTIYSIASLIYISYLSFSYAVSGVFLPKVTKLVVKEASNEVFSNLFIKLGKIQYFLYALVFTGFLLYGKEFIFLWTGKTQTDIWWTAIIIMLPYTIDMIQNLGLSILQAKNCYSIRAKISLASGFLSIILGFLLGSTYGVVGCAVATAISLFLGTGVAMNYCYARFLQVNILGFWKEISKITVCIIPAIFIGLGIDQFIDAIGMVTFSVKISIYVFIYCASGYIINKYSNIIK